MDRFVIRKRKDAEDSSSTSTTSCSTDLNGPGGIATTRNFVKEEGDSSEKRVPNAKRKPGRQFQESWKGTYRWLSYDVATEKAYCDICRLAANTTNTSLPGASGGKEASQFLHFVQIGFSDWRHALLKFRRHEGSDLHREACIAVATAKPVVNVRCKFSKGQQKQMQDARKALLVILSSIRFLVSEGIEIHSQDEEDSNLKQLLLLRAEDVPEMKSWLNHAKYRWISPAAVNEMLEIMAHSVLRTLVRQVKAAEYYSVIVNESTANPPQKQISFCFRIATEDMVVEEFFFGFYETQTTTAETLFSILKDVLRRFDLPLERCRGQRYHGALNAGGRLSGTQALVKAEEPRALCVHCFNHVVNLVVQDVSENVGMCGNFLSELSDMITFVQTSPKLRALHRHFEPTENANLRQFCPAGWTVSAASLQSVASNYSELIQLFEKVSSEDGGPTGANANKYADSLWGFHSYCMLQLLLPLFHHLDSLNTALQESNLQFHQAELLLASAKENAKELQNHFEQIWAQTVMTANNLDLESPTNPMCWEFPPRVEAACNLHEAQSPEDFYREIFYAIIDNVNSSLNNRFPSDVSRHMSRIEKFVLGEEDGTYILNFYKTDFDAFLLQVHRDMLLDIAKQRKVQLLSLRDVISLVSEQEKCLLLLLPELAKLIRISLTVPAFSCTSKRSLSCLHRIKTFLKSNMGQARLNHVTLLYGHQQITQKVDLDVIANEFIRRTAIRKKTFSVI